MVRYFGEERGSSVDFDTTEELRPVGILVA
jgi:hypothetical protein